MLWTGAGGVQVPRADSGRLIVGTWWLVVLVLVTSYSGNLVAFLTFPMLEAPLNSVKEVSSRALSSGLLAGSSLEVLLQVTIVLACTCWESSFTDSIPNKHCFRLCKAEVRWSDIETPPLLGRDPRPAGQVARKSPQLRRPRSAAQPYRPATVDVGRPQENFDLSVRYRSVNADCVRR